MRLTPTEEEPARAALRCPHNRLRRVGRRPRKAAAGTRRGASPGTLEPLDSLARRLARHAPAAA
eukprot:SAG22_NODE_3157_length_1895_cov_1.576837_1_plen_63_part_10